MPLTASAPRKSINASMVGWFHAKVADRGLPKAVSNRFRSSIAISEVSPIAPSGLRGSRRVNEILRTAPTALYTACSRLSAVPDELSASRRCEIRTHQRPMRRACVGKYRAASATRACLNAAQSIGRTARIGSSDRQSKRNRPAPRAGGMHLMPWRPSSASWKAPRLPFIKPVSSQGPQPMLTAGKPRSRRSCARASRPAFAAA